MTATRGVVSPTDRALLKALSDENRLTILLAVADRESSVAELTAATGLGQTLVSHHLKALRENGLVLATPVGRSNVHSLCCEAMAEPIDLLSTLARADLPATAGPPEPAGTSRSTR